MTALVSAPEISHATQADLDDVRALFGEYASSLGFSLAFQGFDDELAALPGRYAPPSGRLLLARVNDQAPVGCVAMRDVSVPGQPASCEMKRLFVRPAFRGQSRSSGPRGRGLGRALVEALVTEARAASSPIAGRYRTMKLDTVPAMASAIALYASIGFRDVAPYTANPIEGARFLELQLGDEADARG